MWSPIFQLAVVSESLIQANWGLLILEKFLYLIRKVNDY